MKGIYFNGIDPAEFKSEIVTAMRSVMEEFKSINTAPTEQVEYLTRSQVAEMLQISETTVYRWTKNGRLTHYGLGNRIYYKRHEIEDCLIYLTPGYNV